MVRRVVRWTLWGVKSLLALVAVAALVAWPWSYRQSGEITGRRWTLTEERVEGLHVLFGWREGRLGGVWAAEESTGRRLGEYRRAAVAEGLGWTWDVRPGFGSWLAFEKERSEAWGPVRYGVGEVRGWSRNATYRYGSLPCWLLALLTGAWPLASAALFVRRRRRARRLSWANRCRGCGYVLRSPPDASGPPLATCPECGAASGTIVAAP
jgi:hypothetical protein